MENIAQIDAEIQKLPDDYLMNEMMSPSGRMPQFLILSELRRRKDMRSMMAAPQTSPGTVKDDLMGQGLGSTRGYANGGPVRRFQQGGMVGSFGPVPTTNVYQGIEYPDIRSAQIAWRRAYNDFLEGNTPTPGQQMFQQYVQNRDTIPEESWGEGQSQEEMDSLMRQWEESGGPERASEWDGVGEGEPFNSDLGIGGIGGILDSTVERLTPGEIILGNDTAEGVNDPYAETLLDVHQGVRAGLLPFEMLGSAARGVAEDIIEWGNSVGGRATIEEIGDLLLNFGILSPAQLSRMSPSEVMETYQTVQGEAENFVESTPDDGAEEGTATAAGGGSGGASGGSGGTGSGGRGGGGSSGSGGDMEEQRPLPGVGGIADLIAQFRGERSDVLGPLIERIEEMEGDIAGTEREANAMALIEAGLAIAGGESPYFATNVAEGRVGIERLAEQRAAQRQAEMQMLGMRGDLASAQASLEQGDIENALGMASLQQEAMLGERELDLAERRLEHSIATGGAGGGGGITGNQYLTHLLDINNRRIQALNEIPATLQGEDRAAAVERIEQAYLSNLAALYSFGGGPEVNYDLTE